MLYEMNDEEKMEFLKGLDKKTIWEMTEGKPDVKTDITSKGESIIFMPTEVINRLNDTASETERVSSEQEKI
jgi:hypothetical protein